MTRKGNADMILLPKDAGRARTAGCGKSRPLLWLLPMVCVSLASVAVAQEVAPTDAKPAKRARAAARQNPAFAYVDEDPALPRVLLIGDSISIGYTLATRKLLEGRANVLRIPTNGGDTTRGIENIASWLGDETWDVIHFNWGLHDLKRIKDGKLDASAERQVPPEDYSSNIEALVVKLKAPRAKLIWASTTPVPEGAAGRIPGDDVLYNTVAAEVMRKHGVETDDLYAVVIDHLSEYQRPANVHFTNEGSAYLAEHVAASILAALPGEPPSRAEALIDLAGNARDDATRLAVLEKLRALPGLNADLKADADRMAREVQRYMTDPRLDYFGSQVLKKEIYDFGIAEDSPLYPLTLIYQARMRVWVTLEYGGYWSDPVKRRVRLDQIRGELEAVRDHFPGNPLIRMYLGEPLPAPKSYEAVAGAPEWAVHQREGLERLADVITWWIDHRQQENGEYGGGWGDDCEMWRWWVPVLIGFDDPRITAAQARFSNALLSQPHMAGGYTTHVYDVEHTSEDSSDALTPMMHLEPDAEFWQGRALRLAELMRTVWTGANARGFLQFKSTYFSVDEVSPDPRKACDTVYHPRALQPALLFWQRTGDPELGTLFTAWLDTWADAAARGERGKPAGVIPSAIHWPDGGIGGQGAHWWDPENHTRDPLYVWPSAMGQMVGSLLLAHHMTGDAKYLEPIRTMAQLRLEYLDAPPAESPAAGTAAWCAAKLGGALNGAIAKHRLLTGSTEFDRLLAKDRGPYLAYRMGAGEEALVAALERNADALAVNFEGYTSEVRYTDRVIRFPALFGGNGMFERAVQGIAQPDPGILYSSATGDPGGAGYFPLNAVRWLTPPRDIAALVDDAGEDRFAARLYHFGDEPRDMGAELYLLAPGHYIFSLRPDSGQPSSFAFQVEGKRTRVSFVLPQRTPCQVTVDRKR
jgi:hypothetical protein